MLGASEISGGRFQAQQGLIKDWVHSRFLLFPIKISQGSFLMPWKSDAIVHHPIDNVDGQQWKRGPKKDLTAPHLQSRPDCPETR